MANKTCVLLVEDNPDLREILVFRLEENDYRVLTAVTGREALERAKADPPDVVVMDLLIPDLDGYQACRLFRKDSQLQSVPIILHSAVFMDCEEQEMGYEVGAQMFVAKTEGFEGLQAAIEKVLSDGEQADFVPSPDEKLAQALVEEEYKKGK